MWRLHADLRAPSRLRAACGVLEHVVVTVVVEGVAAAGGHISEFHLGFF